MKKQFISSAAAVICGLCAVSLCSAQTAVFSYNDGNGTPNAGTYSPGDTFTFAINLGFTSGGAVTNLDGLSYWLQQQTAGPFSFAVTLRDVTGSSFTDLQTPSLSYPQSLNPTNPDDLGAAVPVGNSPLGNGTYLVANITVSISPSAPTSGTFVLQNTISGGKTSVISDSLGHIFAIPEADYTITLVPEPATWVTGLLVLSALAFSQRRRFSRSC